MAATDAKLAILESKLASVQSQLDVTNRKLDEVLLTLTTMPMLAATNSASQLDKILTGFNDALARHEANRKTKKEVPAAATTGEAKEGKADETAAKATHPKFGKIAKTAWAKKSKAVAEHEKIAPFLVAMRRDYEADLTSVVGEAIIKEVESDADYKSFTATKHTPTETATKFIMSMWAMLGSSGRLEEVSKRVVAFYQKELDVLNGQKIDLVKTEGKTPEEAAAASALAK